MFIKEIKKNNASSSKKFISHRLVESYRTPRGPRHRTVLQLGTLSLDRKFWKILADRIEQIASGQNSLFPVTYPDEVEKLAQHYAALLPAALFSTPAPVIEKDSGPTYTGVDLESLETSASRTIGTEYLGLRMFQELGLDRFLSHAGFSTYQVNLCALSIIGRLVHPASEHETREWAIHNTGLGELLETNFDHLSNNALYRISDRLLSHRDELEKHLAKREKSLFDLKEKIILYDLTNTHFEGSAQHITKAKRGRSKQKQKGKPLITLAMIVDEKGFVKRSQLFDGNVSEPKTLKIVLENLYALKAGDKKEKVEKKEVTVVLDAGISTEENLLFLKENGFDYMCVAKNKPVDPTDITEDEMIQLFEDTNKNIKAKRIDQDDEVVLYCHSEAKAKKEQAMKRQFDERFVNELENIKSSLTKKGGVKKYDKVLERLGRAKEKYKSIGHYYTVTVEKKGDVAIQMSWEYEREEKAEKNYSGNYFLRSSRKDLKTDELWSLYIQLTTIESSFKSLKGELGLRPNYHSRESRSDAHMFITVLAYHLLKGILEKLKRKNINVSWETVRRRMESQTRVTTELTTETGERMYIRSTTKADAYQTQIYEALNLSKGVLPNKKSIF